MSARARRRGAQALDGDADVVLVTAGTRTGIAAARSLRRNGVPHVVIGFGQKRLVATSRHVRRYLDGPSPDDVDGFIDFVADAVKRTGASLVLPIDDGALRACDRRRDALAEAGASLAAARPEAIAAVLDKRANLALAQRLGIPCPAQFEIDGLDRIPELVDRIGFPMVLKPSRAPGYEPAQRFSFKWLVAHDESELRALLDRHCREGPLPLFQELVTGHLVGVYCFATAGSVVAMHGMNVLRRSMGQNVYREITPVEPTLAGYAEALLGELSWDGPATLAFFVTADGSPRYMETNGRLWGTVEGSIRAGWDFPYWTVRYFRDGVVPAPAPIDVGSRCCWRAGDYVALRCVLTGQSWLTDRSDVGKLRGIRDYIACFRPGVHSDVFRFDDPLPELVEHWEILRGGIRRRLRRDTPTGANALVAAELPLESSHPSAGSSRSRRGDQRPAA